jgi:hypothetical protein
VNAGGVSFLQENIMSTTTNVDLDAIRDCVGAIKADVTELQCALDDDDGDVANELSAALDPVCGELDRVLRLITALE